MFTGQVSTSGCASLVDILLRIASSSERISIYAITAGIKKYKLIIKKKKSFKHISHHGFVSVNDLLREYHNMKREIKKIKNSTVHKRFWFIYKKMLYYCLKCKIRALQRKKGKLMCWSKCKVSDSKRSTFIKIQGATDSVKCF